MFERALRAKKPDGTYVTPLEAAHSITVFVPKYIDYDDAHAAITAVHERAASMMPSHSTPARVLVPAAAPHARRPAAGEHVMSARLEVRVRRRIGDTKTCVMVVGDTGPSVADRDANVDRVLQHAARTYRFDSVSVGLRMVLRRTVKCAGLPPGMIVNIVNGEIVTIKDIFRVAPLDDWSYYPRARAIEDDYALVVETADGRRAHIYRHHEKHVDIKRIGSLLYEFSGFGVQCAQVTSVSLALGTLRWFPTLLPRGTHARRIHVPVRRVPNPGNIRDAIQGRAAVRRVLANGVPRPPRNCRRHAERGAFAPACIR